MGVLRSRDNPRVRRWTKLARDARLRRSEGRALIEGAHLVAAWLERYGAPTAPIVSESGLRDAEIEALVQRCKAEPVVLSDALFRAVVEVESPAGIAAEIAVPKVKADLASSTFCVFLEGIQDAGNVGAILRSAAAFGVEDAVLSAGCADAWSPKALRAGMGGQFFLRLTENADLFKELPRFGGQVACTVPVGGRILGEVALGPRVGWLFGAEGKGVTEALARLASVQVTIPMPGGTESLNVAAAAAICLYETAGSGIKKPG